MVVDVTDGVGVGVGVTEKLLEGELLRVWVGVAEGLT